MSTNVTHFTKHMNKMIQATDTPEASVTSVTVGNVNYPMVENYLNSNNLNCSVFTVCSPASETV